LLAYNYFFKQHFQDRSLEY